MVCAWNRSTSFVNVIGLSPRFFHWYCQWTSPTSSHGFALTKYCLQSLKLRPRYLRMTGTTQPGWYLKSSAHDIINDDVIDNWIDPIMAEPSSQLWLWRPHHRQEIDLCNRLTWFEQTNILTRGRNFKLSLHQFFIRQEIHFTVQLSFKDH